MKRLTVFLGTLLMAFSIPVIAFAVPITFEGLAEGETLGEYSEE